LKAALRPPRTGAAAYSSAYLRLLSAPYAQRIYTACCAGRESKDLLTS